LVLSSALFKPTGDNNMNSDNYETFSKPEGISEAEWYAIDLSDPLMMVC
jgi:hypothetical protein